MALTDQPSSLAPKSRNFLLKALEVGYSDKVACAMAGVDSPSYERWLEQGSADEFSECGEFFDAVEMAKLRFCYCMETILLRRIARGHLPTVWRYLERRFPETWGPDARQDLAFGLGNAPVQDPAEKQPPAIKTESRRLGPAERGGTATAPSGKPVWGLEEALSFSRAVAEVLANITSRQHLVERAERDAAFGERRDNAGLTAELQSGCERMLDLACVAAGRYRTGTGGADSREPEPEPVRSAGRTAPPESDGGAER